MWKERADSVGNEVARPQNDDGSAPLDLALIEEMEAMCAMVAEVIHYSNTQGQSIIIPAAEANIPAPPASLVIAPAGVPPPSMNLCIFHPFAHLTMP